VTTLETEYRREISRAVKNGDTKRAQELREWAFENHDLDLLEYMVDTRTH
jgi:hypothetical protein